MKGQNLFAQHIDNLDGDGSLVLWHGELIFARDQVRLSLRHVGEPSTS